MSHNKQAQPHSVVFYDHACGICRREMLNIKKRDHLERLQLVDISSDQFEPTFWGLELSDLSEQLHVLKNTGEWLKGVPAVRHVYSEVGLGWIWWSTKLPILNRVSQMAYLWIARNRIKISKHLGFYAKEQCESGSCRMSNDGG